MNQIIKSILIDMTRNKINKSSHVLLVSFATSAATRVKSACKLKMEP